MISDDEKAHIREHFAVPNAKHGDCNVAQERLVKYLKGCGHTSARPASGRVFPKNDRAKWHIDNQKCVDGDGGIGHRWTSVDGMIIDPTASQIGEDEVIFLLPGDERYCWYQENEGGGERLRDEEVSDAFGMFRSEW